MVVIVSSSLCLEPGEAVCDPAVAGITRIEKKIGDQTHRAWVDSRLVQERDGVQTLQCFPNRMPWPEDTEPVRSISVNDWTTWRMTPEDFATLRWIERVPQVNVSYKPPDPAKAARIVSQSQVDHIAQIARTMLRSSKGMPDGSIEILERISQSAEKLQVMISDDNLDMKSDGEE